MNFGRYSLKLLQNRLTLFGIGVGHMILDHFLQLLHVIFGGNPVDRNHLLVYLRVQVAVLIQHIGNAAAHTGRKVFACAPKDYGTASGHILTAVIAYALYHRNGA